MNIGASLNKQLGRNDKPNYIGRIKKKVRDRKGKWVEELIYEHLANCNKRITFQTNIWSKSSDLSKIGARNEGRHDFIE